MKTLCDIYSSKEAEMYLYVKKADGLSRVPEALLTRFGKPLHAMTLLLQPGRQLARADTSRVLESLDAQGFYLQMPPPKESYMQEINTHNSKMV